MAVIIWRAAREGLGAFVLRRLAGALRADVAFLEPAFFD
jgi:hypothetical protein